MRDAICKMTSNKKVHPQHLPTMSVSDEPCQNGLYISSANEVMSFIFQKHIIAMHTIKEREYAMFNKHNFETCCEIA